MADGTINFDTKIDTRTMKAQIKNIDAEIKNLNKDLSNLSKEHEVKLKFVSNEKNAKRYEDIQALYGGKAIKDQTDRDFVNKYEKYLDELVANEEHEKNISKTIDEQKKKKEELKKKIEEINSMEEQGYSKASPKDVKKTTNALVKQLTSIKTMFVGRLKRMFISSIISSLSEGFQSLLKSNGALKGTYNELRNSLTQLGANIVVAFEPIISAIIPIINKLVNLISLATQEFAKFFAIISGKNSYKTAIKNQKDYTKSTNKMLAGFDEINNMDNNNDIQTQYNVGSDLVTCDSAEEKSVETRNVALENVSLMQYLAQVTREWIEQLNLEPLISAISRLKDAVMKLLEPVKTMLSNIYENFLLPIFKKIIETFIPTIIDAIASLYEAIAPFISDYIVPIVNAIISVLVPTFSYVIDLISSLIKGASAIITAFLNVIKSGLDALISFVRNNLASTWTNVWNSIKNVFRSVWNGILTCLETAINAIVNGLNKIAVNIPNWSIFGGLAGKSFGFNMSRVSLPRLATGTNYVPQNMVAMLHKGEAVVPRKFNENEFNNSEETNILLRELINLIDTKGFKAYVTQSDVGKASVDYINSQSRILGGSLI